MSFGTRGRVDHAISGSAMSRRPHFIRCYVTAMVQRLDAHEVARDPDPVDVGHAVELAVGDGHRPDLPELGRPAPEGPPAARHHGLRVLREEPPEELLEPRRGVVVPQRRRRAAGRAPPALGPR